MLATSWKKASVKQFFCEEYPDNPALLRKIPALNEKGAELSTIPGSPPDVKNTLRVVYSHGAAIAL